MISRRGVLIAAAIVVVLVVGIGLKTASVLRTNEPEQFNDIAMHFKYGSIGSDFATGANENGVPYWIWRVLPDVFPDLLAALTPNRPGEGYARLGFIFEPDAPLAHPRPIGTSFRTAPIPVVGVNCAACHVGTVRDTPTAGAQLVLGMPAQRLDFLGYERFLINAAGDSRFSAGQLIPAIKKVNPDFGIADQLLYRFLIIPRMRDRLLTLKSDFSFIDDPTRPAWGPGRVDTFTPYKVRFHMGPEAYKVAGAADFPSLWDQQARLGMYLHWDGNNPSLAERNLSAAIGAGASEDSVDLAGIQRIAEWIYALQPPKVAAAKVDQSLVAAGKQLYDTTCAMCHAVDGARTGKVEPINEIGTDDFRLRSFDNAIATNMNTLGTGKEWQFSHFRSTNGYVGAPLDGIWLRAPYLHNGSVPTLADLLAPASQRPAAFCRGSDVYDFTRVGFASGQSKADCTEFWFDTTLPGNGNKGHEYATGLSDDQKRALLEFLKTQ